MKILHTSDWHVGRRIRGRDRIDEHEAVLGELVALADQADVDVTVVAGDVFDSASPPPQAEQVVWKTLLELSELGPVLVVAGNHDNPARLDAVAPVLDRTRVTVVGAPRPPGEGGVASHPELGLSAALLPFVSQRGIVRAEDIMGLDPDQHAGKYESRMRRIVETLTSGMTMDTVNIVVGHLPVHGAETGGGEHVFDYAVPASVFPGHLSFVALGHYHRQQKMPHAGPVWYSGSPLQLDFGEVSDQKGALLVRAEPGRPATVEELPLHSGRRLVQLAGTLDQVLARADEAGDAWVKVVLSEKARVGLADEVRKAIPGTVDVVLESSEQTRDGREPRRSLNRTEAFHRYLEDRGVDDRELEGLLAELLDEVASAP